MWNAAWQLRGQSPSRVFSGRGQWVRGHSGKGGSGVVLGAAHIFNLCAATASWQYAPRALPCNKCTAAASRRLTQHSKQPQERLHRRKWKGLRPMGQKP